MTNITLDPLWCVSQDNYDPEQAVHSGTKFMISNGYMGYRGTLAHHGKSHLVGCTLAGVYDQNGEQWREPVNAPNALFGLLKMGDDIVTTDENIATHKQALDARRALFKSETVFSHNGIDFTVYKERLLSADNVHVIAQRTLLKASKSVSINLVTGIDRDIWDQNGPHFKEAVFKNHDETVSFLGETNEGDFVAVTKKYFDLPQGTSLGKGLQSFRLELKKNEWIEYSECAVIATTKDVSNPFEHAKSLIANITGYYEIFTPHCLVWEARWHNYDVKIKGDNRALIALRYSIFQLLSVAPRHSDKLAIPARGLSAQVYKGAFFWDTEMHMLPMFSLAEPEMAKKLLQYRTHGLLKAKEKAQQFGYNGAFYPWEAQEEGQEMCSFYNIVDVFTGRPMRTHFVDRQIHVNCAIIYAFWDYYKSTKDLKFMAEKAAELFIESVRFLMSYSYFKFDKTRFELLGVVGPDEYHECVNNNFYTNSLAKFSVEKTLELLARLESDGMFNDIAAKTDLIPSELEKMRYFNDRLYVPAPNEQGVIEQFDGYFGLQDVTLDEVKKRVIEPNEYWGGAYGVAADTQILKQADVVLGLYLLRDEYSKEVKESNWKFYEPRTEHGSSLSPCVYSLLACDVGNVDYAYEYFLKTAEIDLIYGTTRQFIGTMFSGGTHPAANGGAYMSVIYGFAGLKINENHLALDPQLPRHWDGLKFRAHYAGEQLLICIKSKTVRITKVQDSDTKLQIKVAGKSYELTTDVLEITL